MSPWLLSHGREILCVPHCTACDGVQPELTNHLLDRYREHHQHIRCLWALQPFTVLLSENMLGNPRLAAEHPSRCSSQYQ